MTLILNIWDNQPRTQYFYSSSPAEDFELIISEFQDEVKKLNLRPYYAENTFELKFKLLIKKAKKKKSETFESFSIKVENKRCIKLHHRLYKDKLKNNSFILKNIKRNIFADVQPNVYEKLKLRDLVIKNTYENFEI